LSEFYDARGNKDGKSSACKACTHKGRGVGSKEYNAKQRFHYRQNIEKVMLLAAKFRAKRYGLPFDLTIDDIFVPEFCPVFGFKLEIGGTMSKPNRPTLDRRVPSKGYVRGNVQVISWLANKIKGDQTDPSLFERVAHYIRSECKS
jgi:hypothetical protein